MPLDSTQLKRALIKPAALLILALLLLAAAAAVRQVADSIIGPLAIAVAPDGQHIAVAGAGRIYHLDAQGALQGVDVEILDPDTREAGLAWLGNDLLVSPDADGDLLRCTDTTCALFSQDTYAPKGAVQVLVIENRLWISEAGRDRIQRYFDDGRRIDMPLSDLSRPGSLWLQDDQLYVADSGSQKLQRYTMHKRGVDEPQPFATYFGGDKDDPIDHPTRLVRSGDGFRAIFADGDRRNAALVSIDNGGKVTPLAVPDLVNPIALDMLGDTLLVVDEDRMQVMQIAADGKAMPFGDADFRAQLAEKQTLRNGLRIAMPVFVILAVLLLAVGGSWLLSILLSPRGNAPLPVSPGADGITWLPRATDLAPTRIPAQLMIFAPAALVPAVALAIVGYTLVGIVWAALVFAAAAIPPLRDAARTRLPNNLRIGMRDRKLVITDTERGMREYPLPQVAWDDFNLRPEPEVNIPLLRDGVALFHAATYEEVLVPQLNLMKRIEG